MTTVSRVNTVSHSSVSGGGDWDHRLNRLLEDLQETVVPPETRNGATEYREYRMESSTRTNDGPASTTNEKWVEYGTRHPGELPNIGSHPFNNSHSHSLSHSHPHNNTSHSHGGLPSHSLQDSAYSSSNITSSREKTVNFSDENNFSSVRNFGGNASPGGPGPLPGPLQSSGRINNENYTSTKTYNQSHNNMEFLTPANATTVVKSGPSSPIAPLSTSPKVEKKEFYAKASYTTLIKGGVPVESPGHSSHHMIDSRDTRTDRLLEDLLPREPLPESTYPPRQPLPGTSSSITETRRTYTSESTRGTHGGPPDFAQHPHPHQQPSAIGPPLYSSTPLKSTTTSNYSREVINDRSITPPPPQAEGLKTPPLVRKILQQSSNTTSNYHSSKTTTGGSPAPGPGHGPGLGRPPLGNVNAYPNPNSSPPIGRDRIPSYDEPPEPRGSRYYTSTTTTTEHRENRELSPVKRFPSPQPPRGPQYGENPKRLDELLATFDDSSYTVNNYQETRNISGDGGGPHKPHAYGPGTHPIQPVVRSVRIDENSTTTRNIDDNDTDLHQRKPMSNYQNPAYGGNAVEPEPTRNIAGPPIYYPNSQIFPKTEQDALMENSDGKGKGKAKAKMNKEYKAKEKSSSKHSESKGGGAVPIPVCLPVCCAAPCSIM